ncbi:TFIIH basal transcription factor complex, subunit SSL1 [Auricularia subglabra TFB-10046 SS5]|nr:TFIIH basal transcription factor complex, subunit SSL1 [Auricularia subglabra TFB-10046 SS5]
MPPRRNDADYMDVDSDSDVSLNLDDDDFVRPGRAAKPSAAKGKAKQSKKRTDKIKKKKAQDQSYSWEESYTRSWDAVQEDEAGSLQSAVEHLIARGRRRRRVALAASLLAPSDAIRRAIIRHVIIVLDMSSGMMDRDLRPTRFDLMLEYVREFVTEWFDQNPLGQIGIVGMRAGLAERVCDMSGSPQDVLKSISERHKLEPTGDPSLQNALELSRASMSHLPSHSSREVLMIFGSITTVDPGNIHDTLAACLEDKIRISIVALAAEMRICRELCEKSGGVFGVALNEGHFKDVMFELIPPPAQRAAAKAAAGGGGTGADLLLMAFPVRLPESSAPTLCVCHLELKSEGFLCPRCFARVCDVPTDCDVCGIMIVSSPHLARSYHHLFPVKAYTPVMTLEGEQQTSATCHGCSMAFQPHKAAASAGATAEGVSPLGRYRCPECQNDFCNECDIFVHDVLHVCPGDR